MLGRSGRPMTDSERDFFVKLGKRIAEIRRERGLTQVQVAERLEVSQQTVNGFEKGRRRVAISTLLDLAELFDATVTELLGSEGRETRAKRGPPSRLERQMEAIQRLPRSKQRFVMEMLDAVIAQARRAEAS